MLKARADALNEVRLDSLRFQGGGTDLTVGLLPESRWLGAESYRFDGLPYVGNIPTEEVFTTPDARRTEGVVRATRPLPLYGSIVRGLELRFEGGRIVGVRAEAGADVLRGELAADEGAPFLGEVALVDGASRVGQTGLTYFDGLFDENAACHIAYGSCYAECLEDGRLVAGANESSVHTDLMIGGPESTSTGSHATARSSRCSARTSGSSHERLRGPVARPPRIECFVLVGGQRLGRGVGGACHPDRLRRRRWHHRDVDFLVVASCDDDGRARLELPAEDEVRERVLDVPLDRTAERRAPMAGS